MSPPAKASPPDASLPADALERVADAALELVQDGMVLGLGTGRTAEAFIKGLGKRVAGGLRVRGVPTSIRSQQLATSLDIELCSLDEIARLDIDFDGADEVTDGLELTKGRGGALLRERVVAHVSDRFVVLITPDKRVERLGTRLAIPIEVVPFALPVVHRALEQLGGKPELRTSGGDGDYRTDNGNAILDTAFGPIAEPAGLDGRIRQIPGVVDTGLFLGMADLVLIGGPSGTERLER